MKIKLLKNHLDNISGEVIEVNNERGNYLIRVGVAEVKQEKKPKTKSNGLHIRYNIRASKKLS